MEKTVEKIINNLKNTNLSYNNNDCNFDGGFVDNFYFENITDDQFYNYYGIKESYVDFYTKLAKNKVKNIVLGGIYLTGGKRLKEEKPVFRICDFKTYFRLVKNIHRFNSKVYFKIKPAFGREINFNKTLSIFKRTSSSEKDINDSILPTLPASDSLLHSLINEACEICLYLETMNFDGILIDATFENLFGNISSKEFNKRKFGYFTKESDFLCKMILLIKKKCPKLKIIVKLSLFSFIKETLPNYKSIKTLQNINTNINYDERLNILNNLIKSGASGFEFEFGTYENQFLKTSNKYLPSNLFDCLYKTIYTYLINNIKEENLPVILYNNCNFDYKNTIKLIKNKVIHFVNITKNIYSDINFVKKIINNIDYKKCIHCCYCESNAKINNEIKCLINPELFNDKNIALGDKKHIAVIGGGTSGLYTSIILANRKYRVDIYESNDILNKSGIECEIYNSDEYLHLFNKWLTNRINYYQTQGIVNVKYNKMASFDVLDFSKYHAIIIATGFKENPISINGAIQSHVISLYDILKNKELYLNKKNIVIYARTELSLKLALYLTNSKYNISIISSLELLKNANLYNFSYYMYYFNTNCNNFYVDAKINKVNEDNIDLIVNKNILDDTYSKIYNMLSNKHYSYIKQAINVDCDLLIYEPEICPNNKLYYDIVKSGYKGEVYMVGNALEIGDMANDIESAYFVGKNL